MSCINQNDDYAVQEAIITLVRNKLNEEKVKLWLPPYTPTENSEIGSYSDDLVNRFHVSLGIPPDCVKKAFEQLRKHALLKISARNSSPATSPTGLVAVNLKFIGGAKAIQNSEHMVEIQLSSRGEELRRKASDVLGPQVDESSIKIIHRGRVISDSDLIMNLRIKPGTTVLVLGSTNESKDGVYKDQECHANLQKTKKFAEQLSSVDMDEIGSQFSLQVEDQEGRVINLPPSEKKALAVAMTLHERGRAAMKFKNYDRALPYFLEADKEFEKCNSQILLSVDNYALLNLDIVWCYLCLGSVSELPDAERRLALCRDCFAKSYGVNLERLLALKGGHAKESALLARLHLLQGICAFHQNRLTEARTIFERVSVELESLNVDDSKLAEIISFGYSIAEARLALRNCNGNVENAVYHILKKREERKRIKNLERLEREEKRKQMKLGKTNTGEWVQQNLHQQLLAMGYNFDKASEALQQSNNSVSLAVQILQEQQELLMPIDDEKVAILLSMGFDQNAIQDCLRACDGDVAKAQELLVVRLALDPLMPSTSRDISLAEAVNELQDDIPTEEEDYLDLDMQEEILFLDKYLALLH